MIKKQDECCVVGAVEEKLLWWQVDIDLGSQVGIELDSELGSQVGIELGIELVRVDVNGCHEVVYETLSAESQVQEKNVAAEYTDGVLQAP